MSLRMPRVRTQIDDVISSSIQFETSWSRHNSTLLSGEALERKNEKLKLIDIN